MAHHIVRQAPLTGAQIEALRVAVGWDEMPGMYDQILARSYTHFSVTESSRLIGFVNVISDGIADAFLVDLMIHPDFQHEGLGKALVAHAIGALQADGIRCVEVIFAPELEAFYRACGFHDVVKAGIIDSGAGRSQG
jgi:ribosomal protein S18 acetylase RimI-like enzyme